MKKHGVRVRTEDGSLGYIVRRLDADSYEIAKDDDEILVLSPKQFEELDAEEE